MHQRALFVVAAVASLHCACLASTGLRAPEGFEVTLYADDDLAHNIFSMTIDSHGRVVVAGPGYVKTLHDDDKDGRADRATLFSSVPKSGAHGMCFDGDDLVCTGDNRVMRLCDANADGKADGEPQEFTRLRHPEHGANGIIRGPDGWFYLICGNDAGVSKQHAMTASSPVANPQSGAVVRFTPDGKTSEVFAHGFRNPYDIAFDANGHLFTFEADGERDQHLPWYAPCRVFDIAQGMHHGWVLSGWKRSWNRPQSYFDNVERMIEVGRGSPTGVAVYQHTQFPDKYQGGLLFACWSLGKIYFAPLARSGSTYNAQHEVFVETTGDVGFAPVDIAVGPDGDLFIAIGGRGTRGSVFRVRYAGSATTKKVENKTIDQLTAVLRAPQPLASWSRAVWVPQAKRLDKQALRNVVVDPKRPVAERIRAIEILVELHNGLDNVIVSKIKSEQVLARIMWAKGRVKKQHAGLRSIARNNEGLASRFAWEAIQTIPVLRDKVSAWPARSSGPVDRRVFAARAVALARGTGPATTEQEEDKKDPTRPYALGMLGLADAKHFHAALDHFLESSSVTDRMRAVRLAQLCLNDIHAGPAKPEVHAGYLPNGKLELTETQRDRCRALAARFPSRDDELDRELARLLGMLRLKDNALLGRIARKWTAQSTVTDDVHYLIIMSLIDGDRSKDVTRRTAAALTNLHHKMTAGGMYPSRNWPRRVGEAFVELIRLDPALSQVMVACELFGHAEHLMFVAHLPAELHPIAVRKILVTNREAEDPWPLDLVSLIATLPPEESLPALRDQWEQPALRDAIARVLAKHGHHDDRARLIESLRSADTGVVERAAAALAKLEPSNEADELVEAISALRRHLSDKRQRSAREALAKLLRTWSGADVRVHEPKEQAHVVTAYQPWFEWFSKKYPRLAKKLSDRATSGDWSARIARIDVANGDATRGRIVFSKQQCAACHTGSSRLGPDLAGVGGRFAAEDLLRAIVQPDRDVSPTYQATMIETGAGKIYHGIIIYGSPDATLIQTSATQTLRIAGPEIVSIRKSRRSLMPAGLLDQASDRDVADLVAYLRTLK